MEEIGEVIMGEVVRGWMMGESMGEWVIGETGSVLWEDSFELSSERSPS